MKKALILLILCCQMTVLADTVTVISDGQKDGWVKGDSVTNIGVAKSNSGTGRSGLLVGDNGSDSGNQGGINSQAISILSFDTSVLGANAVISSAQISLTRGGLENDITDFGNLYLHINTGTYGDEDLEIQDFQASSTVNQISVVSIPDYTGHTVFSALNQAGIDAINKTGLTQFKLQFETAINNDAVSDRISFFPGNHGPDVYKPSLIIVFSVPTPTPTASLTPTPTISPSPTPTVSPTATPSPTPTPDLDLVGAWPLDEGSGFAADDISGNNNNGTVNGAIWVSGNFSNALAFDGIDDNVDVEDSDTLDLKAKITLMLDVRTTETSTVSPKNIIAKEGEGTTGNSPYAIRLSPDNKPRAMINDGEFFWTTSANPIPTDGTWVNLALTWDGQWLRLYTDGVLVAERRRNTTDFSSVVSTDGSFRIGDDTEFSDTAYVPFKGQIDNIRLFKRVLSVTEIIDKMNSAL